MATKQNFEKLLNSPNVQKMLDLIANAEGVKHGYNTLFGNEKFNDLSQHPNISKEFTQTDGKKNSTTAAGRYQFLKGTWDGVAKQLGLEDFSPKNQDIAAVALLAQNGALPSVLKGDYKAAIQKSGSTWASLPSSPYAQPKKSWEEVGIKNPAREQFQDRSAQIVAAYRAKQKEQEQAAQPKDTGRAQRIVDAYQKARQNGQIQDSTTQPQGLPDFDGKGVITNEQPQLQAKPEQTLGQQLLGAGETALTLGTGAIAAPVASVLGTIGQAGREVVGGEFGSPQAAQRIAQAAEQTGQDFTYQPRTQAGQQQLQAVGEALSPLESLPPVFGGAGVQAAQLARAGAPQAITAAQRTAQAAAPIVERAGQAVQRPVQAVANVTRSGVDSLRDAVGLGRTVDTTPEPANIGAAQVDQATVRQALSQELPYPPQLTEGQLSREPGQLKFEVETSKDADLGAPLRQRQEEQHQVMQQNIDAFIDMTGAKATNMRDVGLAVDSALQKQMQADKNRVRVAYAKADKSEEAQTPVDLMQPVKSGDNEAMSVIDYLNSQPELPTTPILTSAKRTAESIGIARRGENGELIPNNPTIKQMETWRQAINANTNQEAPNIRQTAILKDMIDQHVGPVEGAMYKAARNERKRMAKHWESNAVIKDLTTKKNGTDDRRVALEDVQKRIIHDGSLDDLRVARRALMTSGEEGKQAWKDIQGQTLQEIKNAATANVAPDAQGNQMISPAALNKAVKRLDDDGKLDFIFGQQGAEKVRALNDISKTLFTQPASAAVNHSNTAATLMAALDITMSGLSGFPAPVASALRIATKHIKDNKVRARVQKALNPKGKSI
ncbi:glycoside hydrolase family 24 protein [Acinetobacter dispersus]|uniref:glycoside hydrolase family 24 protein n=1 Tax=Acinetobacter dispersus TaxID=70348 RepID=UPI001F4ADCF5|nr:glycoside hydrolase family 104 protein [Acinetobacter dispersus]MCH7391810.1 glycoside hydrolase family 104 protein [Acinetobacter dispersus]